MSELSCSQFVALFVIVMLRGVRVAAGLTPIAALTPVIDVAVDGLEYQATSSRPFRVATRSAGNMVRPPRCGRSSTVGDRCTRESDPSLKLCSMTSPYGWSRVSFHTMLTVSCRLLTASLGKSLPGNRRSPGMNAESSDVTFTLLRRAG